MQTKPLLLDGAKGESHRAWPSKHLRRRLAVFTLTLRAHRMAEPLVTPAAAQLVRPQTPTDQRRSSEILRGLLALLVVLMVAGGALRAECPLPDLHDRQWNLQNFGQDGGTVDADIDAPEAWCISGTSEVVVAVIDLGIDINYVEEESGELAGKLWENPEDPSDDQDNDGNNKTDDTHGWNFFSENADLIDRHGHGTRVAGVIAARTNNGGIDGICPTCKLMILKVGDSRDGPGKPTWNAIAQAIRYATEHAAQVINLSISDYNSDNEVSAAIAEADRAGVVVIVSIGNDDIDAPSFPSILPETISIGATDRTDKRWDPWSWDPHEGSNWGTSLDLVAPGVAIPTIDLEGRYTESTGTSAAAPHVAAAAGLLLSKRPSLTAADVRHILLSSADPDIDPNTIFPPTNPALFIGEGRLNLYNALSRIWFSDVDVHAWYNDYLAYAYQQGVIRGYFDGT